MTAAAPGGSRHAARRAHRPRRCARGDAARRSAMLPSASQAVGAAQHPAARLRPRRARRRRRPRRPPPTEAAAVLATKRKPLRSLARAIARRPEPETSQPAPRPPTAATAASAASSATPTAPGQPAAPVRATLVQRAPAPTATGDRAAEPAWADEQPSAAAGRHRDRRQPPRPPSTARPPRRPRRPLSRAPAAERRQRSAVATVPGAAAAAPGLPVAGLEPARDRRASRGARRSGPWVRRHERREARRRDRRDPPAGGRRTPRRSSSRAPRAAPSHRRSP